MNKNKEHKAEKFIYLLKKERELRHITSIKPSCFGQFYLLCTLLHFHFYMIN